MTSTIAAAASLAAQPWASATPRPVGLDAALAKSRSQRADCVACASAKTPEGQARIQALDNRIGAIEAQMERADQARRDATSTNATATATAPTQRPSLAPIGTELDTYA